MTATVYSDPSSAAEVTLAVCAGRVMTLAGSVFAAANLFQFGVYSGLLHLHPATLSLSWPIALAIFFTGLARLRAGGGANVRRVALWSRMAIGAQILIALAYGWLSLGGWDLWRFARPLDWPFSPELWTYEHLWKMLGAYSAVWSAFAGNFLTFVPSPWSALWPTVLFQSLSLIWLVSLLVRKRRIAVPA